MSINAIATHAVRVASLFASLLAPTLVLSRPFMPQDLVRLSRIESPVVSSDGRWLVWEQRETELSANKSRHELWSLDIGRTDALPEKLAPVAGMDARAPAFGPDGSLYFLSALKGKTAVWRVAMSGGAPIQVTGDYDLSGFKLSPKGDAIVVWADRPVGARSLEESTPSERGDGGSARIYDHLFVRHWDTWGNGMRSQLFVIPIQGGHATGSGHAIEGALVGDTPPKPLGGGEEIAWSPDGRTLYFALCQAGPDEALSVNFDIFAVPADGSAAPVDLTAGNPAIDTLPAVSSDGRWLAWLATSRAGYEADRRVVMLRNLVTGKVRALTAAWDRSVDSIAWSPDSGSLYVTAAERLDHPAFQIDVANGMITRLTREGHVSGISPLPQGGLTYLLDSLTAPRDIWRRDQHGATSQLTRANAARLAGVHWPTVTRFSFKGANGDTVWGFTMRPADLADSVKVPTAYFVHGGPQGSLGDAWSYRMNVAAWAGHGYAALSVDFHGSTGYGQAFTDSINNDWGGKPLIDLKAGLRAATERFTFLDADNVCGVGGSYGGYMMNWIEGEWPDRFRCLVQDDGVFDVRSMAYETDELWADKWDHGGRLYFEAPTDYERWNPANQVARWRTPQLVITGERDFRSPYTQAIAAYTALQLRHVPSRLIVFPDEGHWVEKPQNSLEWYTEVFRWLDSWTRSSKAGQT